MIAEENEEKKHESSVHGSGSTVSNSQTLPYSGSTPQANNSLSPQSPALYNDRDSYETTAWYRCLLALIMIPVLALAIWTYWYDVVAVNDIVYLYEDLIVWTLLGAPFFVFFYALIFVLCHSAPQKRRNQWWEHRLAPVLLMLSLATFIVFWSWYSLFGDINPFSISGGLLEYDPSAYEIFTGTVAGLTFYVVWGICVIYVLICFGIASRHLFVKT